MLLMIRFASLLGSEALAKQRPRIIGISSKYYNFLQKMITHQIYQVSGVPELASLGAIQGYVEPAVQVRVSFKLV